MKHILIIGGMGPQASIHAHRRLIELAGEGGTLANQGYPRITHLSVNVRDFISDEENKAVAVAYLVECLGDINMRSVDVGFIACNTAHLLFDSLEQAVGGKLVSMIECTQKEITGIPTGIVATPSTIRQRLYGDAITIEPDTSSLKAIEGIIRKVIAGVSITELVPDLQREIDKLTQRGAEKVVLGCSELSMFNRHLDEAIIVDPIDVTIKSILNE